MLHFELKQTSMALASSKLVQMQVILVAEHVESGISVIIHTNWPSIRIFSDTRGCDNLRRTVEALSWSQQET
jgi:hypothetical protein